MKSAGVNVISAFDQDEEAIETYRSNMPQDTASYCREVSSWIETAQERRYRPAFLHLSCPCQPYSPAHTKNGKDDMINRDCLLTIGPVIDIVRPRILTLEQTFGIIKDDNQLWFTALKSQLVERKYSFRTKLVDMRDRGVAQTRHRLIVIGSAPGESLPSFPRPSTPAGYWPSIGNVLEPLYAAIKAGETFENHNPKKYLFSERASQQVEKIGQVNTIRTYYLHWPIHWNKVGQKMRLFTIEEAKLAEGFDLDFKLQAKFGRTALSKQIGNAVPPPFAKDLFRHLVAHLIETDIVEFPGTSEGLLRRMDNQPDNSASFDDEEQEFNGFKEAPDGTEHDFDGFNGFDERSKGIESRLQGERKRSFTMTRDLTTPTNESESETSTSKGRLSEADGESSDIEQSKSRKRTKRSHGSSRKSSLREVQSAEQSDPDKESDTEEESGIDEDLSRIFERLSSPDE